MSPTPSGPPTREAVDARLARLDAEAARISESLLELADHPGYRLLENAPLTGETARRWQANAALVAALWDDYTGYQDVLNRAGEIRARRPKPRPEELAAIAALLDGPSITLSTKTLGLSERTLLGPSAVARTATLAESVARMDTGFRAVAEFVAAADTAWNRLFQQADPVGRRLAEVIAAVREIGERPIAAALAAIGDEYAALRKEIFADPIGLCEERSGFPARLASVREALEALATTAADAADLRADFERRRARLAALLERVEDAEAAQRAAESEVREKILVAALPAPTDGAPALRARLAALGALREGGRWTRLAEEAAALETALGDALAAAARTRQAIGGLLERREELRGRLSAYRVRAARLGAAEDSDLEAYYRAARDHLWSKPCDLAASTRALAVYQKAVLALDSSRGGVV